MRVLVRINEREQLDREKLHVPAFSTGLGLLTNDRLAALPRTLPISNRGGEGPGGGGGKEGGAAEEEGALVQTSFSRELSAADVFFEPSQPGQLAVLYDLVRAQDAGHIEVGRPRLRHTAASNGRCAGGERALCPLPRAQGWWTSGGRESPRRLRPRRHLHHGPQAMAPASRKRSSLPGLPANPAWRLQEAMEEMLGELSDSDVYNIVTFGLKDEVEFLQSVPATPFNRAASLRYLTELPLGGGLDSFVSSA